MFPRAYVRSKDIPQIQNRSTESEVTALYGIIDVSKVINENKRLYIDTSRGEFCEHGLEGFEEFIEIMYNYVLGLIIDPVNGEVLFDFVIENPRKKVTVFVPRGVKVVVIEARGKAVHSLVEEGDEVVEQTKVFYITTRKYEVRVVRTPVRGVVVHIGEIVQSIPQTLVMVIADANSVRWLRRSDRC
ncbi:MAG TPA: DUF2118 domain-containing protein [Ignisphaera sp.]|uniref:DUF2118 domain-containing protein n=1 Tax=Ignisphaera aggregans TaxID=334771 RepID=A0A832YZ91_9CREN|nr:DUF2118 domain-containing protein [Ignisphaera sp.]HIP56506.1 DUF2118 domain-containing protein [Ignisphaera aggregans]